MSIRLSEPENLNDKKMLKHKKGIKKTRKNLLLITTTTTTTITTTTAATTSTTITTVTCNKDLKEHRNLVDAISQDATLFLRRASLFLRLPAQGEAHRPGLGQVQGNSPYFSRRRNRARTPGGGAEQRTERRRYPPPPPIPLSARKPVHTYACTVAVFNLAGRVAAVLCRCGYNCGRERDEDDEGRRVRSFFLFPSLPKNESACRRRRRLLPSRSGTPFSSRRFAAFIV